MLSISLDTTSRDIYFLIKEKELIIYKRKVLGNNNFTELLPIIFEQSSFNLNIDFKQVEEVFIGLGPGSFTGSRIGLAFIKGFIANSNIKCFGRPTALSLLDREFVGINTVIFDGRRDELLVSIIKQDKQQWQILENKVIKKKDLFNLNSDLYFSYLSKNYFTDFLPANKIDKLIKIKQIDLSNFYYFKASKSSLNDLQPIYIRDSVYL